VIGLAVSDISLIQDAVPTLYVISFSMFMIAIGFTMFAVVTGSGNTKTALVIEIIIIFLYMLICYTLGIVMKASVHIIWFTEPLYFMIMGIAGFLFFKFGNWRHKQI